jgi:hypothetical protein
MPQTLIPKIQTHRVEKVILREPELLVYLLTGRKSIIYSTYGWEVLLAANPVAAVH